MSKCKDTNEFRIQKIGFKGSPPTHIAQRKVLVWNNWSRFSKKPSGHYWTGVVYRGKKIGGSSLELVKDDLENYIKDLGYYKDCNETVYEIGKTQEK